MGRFSISAVSRTWGQRVLDRLNGLSTRAPPVPQRVLAMPGVAGGLHAEGLCILVVDDDPFNLMMASEMLGLWGIRPLQARDGAEAVALACELHLDLILMDLQMPVLDGFSATNQIRAFERDHARTRVPIVAFTSNPSADRQQMLDCGLDAVLCKPCGVAALHECLWRWCEPASAGSVRGSRAAASPGSRPIRALEGLRDCIALKSGT